MSDTSATRAQASKQQQQSPSQRRRKSCLSSVSEHSTLASKTTSSNNTSLIMCMKKSVSFSQVEIREHERILGDNPACSNGPAVSLAWRHHSQSTLTVSEYEDSRPPRRAAHEFQMPSSVRRSLLLQQEASGGGGGNTDDARRYTPEELQESQREIRKIQHQRRSSHAMQEFEGSQLLVESVGRKVKRLFGKNGSMTKRDKNNKNASSSSSLITTLSKGKQDKKTRKQSIGSKGNHQRTAAASAASNGSNNARRAGEIGTNSTSTTTEIIVMEETVKQLSLCNDDDGTATATSCHDDDVGQAC